MPAVDHSFATAFESLGTKRRVRRGERPLQEGNPAGSVLMILEGTLRVATNTAAGDEVAVAIRGPGDLMGQLGALAEQPAGATVIAREQGEVVVMPSGRFVNLLNERPDHRATIFSNVIALLAESEARRVRWLTQDIPHRLAAELILLADLCAPGETGSVRIPVTHTELAGLCGTARSSASDGLATLADEGLIRTGRGFVTVPNPTALNERVD